ncbi:uncharacterized protein KZ484_021231 [Pholidichthys leucotaenia]
MSTTPIQDPPPQGLSSDSGQTLPSRPLQPSSDPSASKKVCFYKSGDYQFSGHRMVINARTFKTFDALLDALSKKVPLSFGVRTVTTPRGTHLIKALDDLHDGGAYVCSDQKRVKPLNLDEVNKRQVPWNTTRPLSVGRRRRRGLGLGQAGSRNEAISRPAKVTERVAVRTPKRLTVIKNRDPSVKRTIVLQRRTAPTFEALLDYLSQILQFPVLKLYSTDGRRVAGLASLILCSGVVVAAGNEPFRLANYNFQRIGQITQAAYMETVEPSSPQPRTQKTKSFSSGRGSRNFSLSSERHIVDQINKSQNGGTDKHLQLHNGSPEADISQCHTSIEPSVTGKGENETQPCIVPQDDDIEKSFRVNQDGSMTVEMRVRLTVKEEEMLHWTTTLSRSSLSKGTTYASVSELGNRSPDSNNAFAKDTSSISEDEMKEENYSTGAQKGIGFSSEPLCENYTSTAVGKVQQSFKRTPTPGPRHIKKASVESVKMVTESGVQESMLGHYSYMERTADGETTEGYCMVRHSSSSSSRPIPKPRKTVSGGAGNKCSNSSIRSSGVADILQIQNNGVEVTETVMHIYESQGCYDNYFANVEYSTDGVPLHATPLEAESKRFTDSGPRSSSNDCDIDSSWQPPTADSEQRQKEEMLSLSSEPPSLPYMNTTNLSSVCENKTHTGGSPQSQKRVKNGSIPKSMKKKTIANERSSTSTSSTGKKIKQNVISPSKTSKHSNTDRLSSKASVAKKSVNSSISARSGENIKKAEKKTENPQPFKDEKIPKTDSSNGSTDNIKRILPKKQNVNKAGNDNGHNVYTPTRQPQMRKNTSDIFQTKKSPLLVKKTKSMTDNRMSPPRNAVEVNETVSMPSLGPSPSEIHQFVENWLENVSPDQVPYTEDAIPDSADTRPKVVFKIGGDSESEEKSESQAYSDESFPPLSSAVRKSTSTLSVPLSREGAEVVQGLSVSMPNVRVNPNPQRPETISPQDNEASSSNILSTKAKIQPILQKICSSIQSIRSHSDISSVSSPERSSRLPDFPSQITSVFGSSCKVFLSFLSVMTLRDHLICSEEGDESDSRDGTEAMLMMESLQKISTMEDEEEQRASLTDLQNKASSHFRRHWRDFLIRRERLESEPLSPKVSETEFALDVMSEGCDDVEGQNLVIDELMEELRMPQDLRAEIASTINQTKTFYPEEDSLCIETDRPYSDSEEDVEYFVKECGDGAIKLPGLYSACIPEDIMEAKQCNDNAGYTQQVKNETEQETDEAQELQTDREEFVKDKENEADEEKQEEEEEEREEEEEEDVKIREYGNTKDIGGDSEKEEKEKEDSSGESEKEETHNEESDDWEGENGSDEESVEKVGEETGEERSSDEGEVVEKTVAGKTDEEAGEFSVEETDEREGVWETEDEENKGKDEVREEENDEEGEIEEEQEGSISNKNEKEEEVRENEEETDEQEDLDSVTEVEQEEDKGEDEEPVNLPEDVEQEGEEDENVPEVHKEENEIGEVIMEGHENDEAQEEADGVTEKDKIQDLSWEPDEVEQTEGSIEKGCEENIEEEQMIKVLSEKNNMDDEENEDKVAGEQEWEHDEEEGESEDVLVKNIEEIRAGTDEDQEEEEKEKGVKDIEDDEMHDEVSQKGQEKTESYLEEESVEETETLDGSVIKEATTADQSLDEDEREDDKRKALNNESKDTVEYVENFDEEEDCKNLKSNAEQNTDSPSKYSSDCQCAEDKGNGTDSINELETDDGGEQCHETSSSLFHPVEISQELLDFVNYALQSSSLIFTYDTRGNIRIEPDNARVVQTKQMVIPKRRKDSSYGLKCLPSPSTSDLSDYRPESSVSGGYKTQESADIISESGEEASSKPSPVYRQTGQATNVEQVNSKWSDASHSEALHSSSDLGTKASGEDLSYFSAASSLKANTVCTPQTASENSSDGVLIDQGRWLLKENHLIRKSPPVSQGMYGNLDSASLDTGQENTSEDSLPHYKTQHSPLAAISSSELEEMAKPLTPKCTYYNMPHGSDSDPFLDDPILKGSVKGRCVRVSPTLDTSKTWANKNGSQSSFASVEFKILDTKVHPEGESSVVAQPSRTSGGRAQVLQAQNSMDGLHLRCGQCCSIL